MWKPKKLLPWLIAGSLAWSLGYLYNVYYFGELSWLRRMYNAKVANSAEINASSRLIIIGGSGAHFTINSPMIEEGIGIPVLNLGLDGPVGLNLILSSAIDKVKAGDIVLLIPEYMLLLDEDGIGDRSVGFALATGNLNLKEVPLKELVQDTWLLGIPSLNSLSESVVDLIEEGEITGYYGPITERGDPVITKNRTSEWWKMSIPQSISPHAVEEIKKFREELEAKDAHLIISLPWVYAQTDDKTVKNVLKTAQELEKIAPLIYDPQSLNLKTDSSLFADTHYHLLPESRKIRAEELVKQLQPIIKKIEAN